MICKGFTKCGERCKKTTNSKYCHLHRECAKRVQEKIRINIKEKRWKNPKQAIAVAYSQTRNRFPECGEFFIKKNNI
jgi:hypothetical protein